MELPEIGSFGELKAFLDSLTQEQIKKLKFTQAMELVDAISRFFDERGDEMDIEDALGLYEKGMDLLMHCREKLAVVQEKKEQIDKKYKELLKNSG